MSHTVTISIQGCDILWDLAAAVKEEWSDSEPDEEEAEPWLGVLESIFAQAEEDGWVRPPNREPISLPPGGFALLLPFTNLDELLEEGKHYTVVRTQDSLNIWPKEVHDGKNQA